MLVFSTKAETLEALASSLKNAKILPQICVNLVKFNEANILGEIERKGWDQIPLIVRSSFANEDQLGLSCAGRYLSVGNVKGISQIQKALQKVIHSKKTQDPFDQVFIQPYLQGLPIVGVAFSSDSVTGAPYYVINYDNETGLSHSITAGGREGSKIFYVHRSRRGKHPVFVERILNLLEELEYHFGTDALDIEFAFSKEDELYLLQVRPLKIHSCTLSKDDHISLLENVEDQIQSVIQSSVKTCGYTNLLGVMPDWNPAEIIGRRPRPLSLSLYKELITDGIWAKQRKRYGYRYVGDPVLIDFFGLPYIETSKSFESFIPASLSQSLSQKLLRTYLKRLHRSPHLHDKIEFEVVFSSYTPSLKKRLLTLKEEGFSSAELKEIEASLLDLTNIIIHPKDGLYLVDLQKIQCGFSFFDAIRNNSEHAVGKIRSLVKMCKKHGTFPFAGIARTAFIAMEFLNSLVDLGIFSIKDKEGFLNSLETICSQMQKDLLSMDQHFFIQKYGHLREGTYDICSLTYGSFPKGYFMQKKTPQFNPLSSPFEVKASQKFQIDKLLKTHRIALNTDEMMVFLKTAIEGREFGKFIFTQALSHLLELVVKLGKEIGLTREECSFLDIQTFLSCKKKGTHLKAALIRSYEQGRLKYEKTKALLLPPLLFDACQVWGFHIDQGEPNYVTLKKARGTPCEVFKNRFDLDQKIVMIPSADPGFDWIFSRPIAGLITMYGGANSHMAIRANELGIPSVIGAGEVLYQQWSAARFLDLDCENKIVRTYH